MYDTSVDGAADTISIWLAQACRRAPDWRVENFAIRLDLDLEMAGERIRLHETDMQSAAR